MFEVYLEPNLGKLFYWDFDKTCFISGHRSSFKKRSRFTGCGKLDWQVGIWNCQYYTWVVQHCLQYIIREWYSTVYSILYVSGTALSTVYYTRVVQHCLQCIIREWYSNVYSILYVSVYSTVYSVLYESGTAMSTVYYT